MTITCVGAQPCGWPDSVCDCAERVEHDNELHTLIDGSGGKA